MSFFYQAHLLTSQINNMYKCSIDTSETYIIPLLTTLDKDIYLLEYRRNVTVIYRFIVMKIVYMCISFYRLLSAQLFVSNWVRLFIGAMDCDEIDECAERDSVCVDVFIKYHMYFVFIYLFISKKPNSMLYTKIILWLRIGN